MDRKLSPKGFPYSQLTNLIQAANDTNLNIQKTTRSVHENTVQIVDNQMKQLDSQLQNLDGVLSRVRSQAYIHETSHVQSIEQLGASLGQSCIRIEHRFENASEQAQMLGSDVIQRARVATNTLRPLKDIMQDSLASLREEVLAKPLIEYVPTGGTPQKIAYQYPSTLPRTIARPTLLHHSENSDDQSPRKNASREIDDRLEAGKASPTKGQVYTDIDLAVKATQPSAEAEAEARDTQFMMENNLKSASLRVTSTNPSLREVDINTIDNVKASAILSRDAARNRKNKRTASELSSSDQVMGKKLRKALAPSMADGAENTPLAGTSLSDKRIRNLRARGT